MSSEANFASETSDCLLQQDYLFRSLLFEYLPIVGKTLTTHPVVNYRSLQLPQSLHFEPRL